MAEQENLRAVRVNRFASFFKHYMGASTIVTAALPIPIAEFKLIPIYDSERHLYAIYTSLFAFLIFSFTFHIRHFYANVLFAPAPPDWSRRLWQTYQRTLLTLMPLGLICGSLYCALIYHTKLNNQVTAQLPSAQVFTSLQKAPSNDGNTEQRPAPQGLNDPLKEAPSHRAGGPLLMMYYLGIFICAELAFVLMAMKEYLLDVFKITDEDLAFYGSARSLESAKAIVEHVSDGGMTLRSPPGDY